MSYLDDYRNRVQSSTLTNSSKTNVNRLFNSHPYLQSVTVNGTVRNVIVTQSKESEDKTLLFEPNSLVDVGSVVVINTTNYLVFDFLGEGINEIYPTATLKRCNSTFPLISNKTRNLMGYDSDGRPVPYYEETVVQEPCIVSTSYPEVNNNAKIVLPEGKLLVTLKYQTGENLKVNETFEMYGNTYKISNFDYTKVINGKGIMTIHAEQEV